ncbi:MAG: HPF/RaiA family ribosome-associated protein [Patescibacteria group bacterium]
MSYQITSTNFRVSPRTSDLIHEKLKKIEKHLVDVSEELKDLRIVVNKAPGFGYLIKLELWIPGAAFVAKEGGFSLEGVVDEAVGELVRQIDKHKGRAYSKDKRLLREFKNFVFYSRHLKDL